MTEEEIKRIVSIYYSNLEFIEKNKKNSAKEDDIKARTEQNRLYDEQYGSIIQYDAFKKLNGL